jgi:hypothetical protein
VIGVLELAAHETFVAVEKSLQGILARQLDFCGLHVQVLFVV